LAGTLDPVLRRPRPPLVGALAGLAGLVLTGALAYLSPVAHGRDSATLQGFVGLNRPRLTPLVTHVAHLADPVPFALIGLALTAVALARGRVRLALAVPLVLVLAGATAELLKPLLAHPRYSEWLGEGQIAAAAWPSGHATAAMTLALCGVLAAPARLRPTAGALGGAFAIAVSYAILVLGWHFPSDVIGGFLVAALWTLLAVAALNALELRRPTRARQPAPAGALDTLGPLVLGGASAALAVAVALQRPRAVADYAVAHTTFAAGAAVIAAVALALAAGLVRGMRT
jgi:membrane-associated phospholipid phosphatase